jgi:hypothetical protein
VHGGGGGGGGVTHGSASSSIGGGAATTPTSKHARRADVCTAAVRLTRRRGATVTWLSGGEREGFAAVANCAGGSAGRVSGASR